MVSGGELRPAQFAVISSAHVQIAATIANGLTGRPGGMAVTSTVLRAGQALIVKLCDLHRSLPFSMALSAVTAPEVYAFGSIEDLCDDTYSVLFKSGVVTQGEEIAIVISEQGAVHVSHAGRKWLKGVHIDPSVEFRVVFDMQTIKKLAIVGVTNQLQAPADAADTAAAPAPAQCMKGGGDNLERPATDCVICLENPRDTLIKPCLHFVLCGNCARSLMNGASKECPMCRKPIQDTQRIYMN